MPILHILQEDGEWENISLKPGTNLKYAADVSLHGKQLTIACKCSNGDCWATPRESNDIAIENAVQNGLREKLATIVDLDDKIET